MGKVIDVPPQVCYAAPMKSNEAGTPRTMTIDAAGNIVPKPYGAGRWANPRFYECRHPGDCNNSAKILWRRLTTMDESIKSHNCCGEHEHPEGAVR